MTKKNRRRTRVPDDFDYFHELILYDEIARTGDARRGLTERPPLCAIVRRGRAIVVPALTNGPVTDRMSWSQTWHADMRADMCMQACAGTVPPTVGKSRRGGS